MKKSRWPVMFICFLLGVSAHSLMSRLTVPTVEADCTDQPCRTPPCCNGDVNGDGKIDLADAVSLLTYIFADGGMPRDIVCTPIISHFPDTGLAICTDADGNTIDCDSNDFPGQDAFYQSGCPSDGRFEDNGDGTITDHCTGLMWCAETADVNDDGWIGGPDALTWQQGLKYCENLEFAGHTDWRLPNIMELLSIVNYNEFVGMFYPEFTLDWSWYMTSTTYMGAKDGIWAFSFENARSIVGDKKGTYYLLPVRLASQ